MAKKKAGKKPAKVKLRYKCPNCGIEYVSKTRLRSLMCEECGPVKPVLLKE